jgi:hypothetical protein
MFVKILFATLRSPNLPTCKEHEYANDGEKLNKICDLRKQRLFSADPTLIETPCGTDSTFCVMDEAETRRTYYGLRFSFIFPSLYFSTMPYQHREFFSLSLSLFLSLSTRCCYVTCRYVCLK